MRKAETLLGTVRRFEERTGREKFIARDIPRWKFFGRPEKGGLFLRLLWPRALPESRDRTAPGATF